MIAVLDPSATKMVTLDGVQLSIRPIRPDDAERLIAFHSTLSDESIYMRYFSAHPRLSLQEVERFTHVDGDKRAALVVLDGDRVVAVGRFDRIGDQPKAEVAFVVTDTFQRRGIATALLRALSGIARAHGIDTLVADTLFSNNKMRRVFKDAGYPVKSEIEAGVVHVEFSIDPLLTAGEVRPL
jgi:GNAT superfamily N-acetyltransferase